ncbi:MAG: hypothetical protein NC293_03765 [Roseburia sp.]|nr:hypothetical protein [Roseburia sp.]
MKKYMRVIAVFLVLSFCETLHSRTTAEAAMVVTIEQGHDESGKVFHTLVTYSDKIERYHAHLETYVNRKMADYTHKIFSGSGYRYMESGHFFSNTGDMIELDGYVVK